MAPLEYRPSHPWRRRIRRPCGLLYNTGSCPYPADCPFSHDARDVDSWRRSIGRKPCVYGPMCDHYYTRRCIYNHPPASSSAAASKYATKASPTSAFHNSIPERPLQMMAGLLPIASLGQWSTNLGSPACADSTSTGHRYLSIHSERVLASYNKIANDKIAVPGFPQQFVPPVRSLSVKLDAEESRDKDKEKDKDNNKNKNQRSHCRRAYPTYTHSLEPLLRSVQLMAPAYDLLASTHIVANTGSLYRLFHYLSGTAIVAHRFDLEWRPAANNNDAEGTLLMQQWSHDPDHKISYGRGHNFASMTCHYPDAAPDFLHDSFTHHRVLSYGFGDLQLVIHCEADGFYDPEGDVSAGSRQCADMAKLPLSSSKMPDTMGVQLPPTPPMSPLGHFSQPVPCRPHHCVPPSDMPTPPSSPPPPPPPTGSRFSVLDLEGGSDLDSEASTDDTEVAAPDSTTPSTVLSSATLEVAYHPATRAVPSEKLVEIKTYNALRAKQSVLGAPAVPLIIPPEPQLYFGRTMQLYKAAHTSGRFRASGQSSGSGNGHASDEQVRDMTDTLRQWERDQQAVLSRLHGLLQFLWRVMAAANSGFGGGDVKLCLVCPGPYDAATVPMQLCLRSDERSFLPAEL